MTSSHMSSIRIHDTATAMSLTVEGHLIGDSETDIF